MVYHPIGEFQGSEDWSSRIIHPGPDLSLFLQAGIGAIARRLHEKVAAILSPMDFGAVGDGYANDQAMFDLLEAAFPVRREVDLEGRTYLVTTKPTGHSYRNGSFLVGSTLYPASVFQLSDLSGDSAELAAFLALFDGLGKASFFSSVASDLQAVTDKLVGTGKAAFLSSSPTDLQAITDKLAGTGKAAFLSNAASDLQAITTKLAGTGKAGFLSNVAADLQAITDKLAGTVKAATLTNDPAELAAIVAKLGVSTGGGGGGGITVVTAADLSSTASELEAMTAKLRYKGPYSGEVSISLPTLFNGDAVNVRRFGVTLNGTTDDTAAWNLALASGRNLYFPEGVSKITGKLNMPNVEGVSIRGAGRDQSQFWIDYTSFNMAASCVVECNAAYQGIHDLCFHFVQPETSIRANVKQYPEAINLNGHSRGELSCLRFEGAWVGIIAQGNCGGLVIDDIQMGALSQGLIVDGSLDSVRVNRYHFWPFGIGGGALFNNVYSDGNTVSANFGRCDDLNMSSILSFRGRLVFDDYGLGNSFGVASDITLDSDYGRIEFNSGEMTMSGVYGSTAAPVDFIISMTGGELKIAGLALEAATDLTTYAMVQVSGGVFMASDIMSTVVGTNTRAFRQTGGVMKLVNGHFSAPPNVNRPLAMIEVVDGRATLIGLSATDKGTGTGNLIQVLDDDFHVITGNAFVGWGYAIPSAQSTGVYGPNSGVPGKYTTGGMLADAVATKRLTGTLNGSGDVTASHGITGVLTNLISISAFYTGPSGEAVMIPSVTVDGASVVLAAGAPGASRPYTIHLSYA